MINATSFAKPRPILFKLSLFTCWRRGGRRASGGETLLTNVSEDEMAFWPFGRKSKKKTDVITKSSGASAVKSPKGPARNPASEAGDVNSFTAGGKPKRKSSHRRSSRKLTKVNDSKMKDPEKLEPTQTIPIPSQSIQKRPTGNEKRTTAQQPFVPSDERGDVPPYYFQNPASITSLQPENFSAFSLPPTLRARKNGNDPAIPRRKSSKRKADDHAREKEIKAMSSPIPIPKRPASRTGGHVFGDSGKDLNSSTRNFKRPLSDVSLPIPESIHSTMSVVSDSHGFRVSALDALAPRPTIRYFENPRNKEFGSGSFGPTRSSTKRERQPFTPEDGFKPNQRIAHLADELDAGSLRELMDRDQRRSERTRRSEQEKLQRKLQRKADSQQAAEAAGEERYNGSSKENIRPSDRGDDDVGMNISTSPTAATSSDPLFRDQGTVTPEIWRKDASREHVMRGGSSNGRDGGVTPDNRNDTISQTEKAGPLSQASMSPPSSPNPTLPRPFGLSPRSDFRSRSPLDIQEHGETSGRDSDTSGRLTNNWTSIFRRSGTRAKDSSADRGRPSPSEFSNTSRESFTRQPPPSSFARVPPARSGTPIRTQSRFREDLPELPLSPPDSRLQSSEPTERPQQYLPDPRSHGVPESAEQSIISDQQLADIHPAFRDQILQSRNQPANHPSPEIPSSAILSQSLASVDSEGSWLTGRPMKRTSPTFATPLRGSASSLRQRSRDLGASDDELGAAENEHDDRSRVTPEFSEGSGGEPVRKRPYLSGSSGIGGDGDSDDDNVFHPQPPAIPPDEGKWHGAVGKHPTIVRSGPVAKSREGLLDDFQAGEDSVESSPSGESPVGQPFGDQITPPEKSLIYRATSVDLGKGHARHISAGSARLLDLPPRSSGESKRFSTASGERSPLGISSANEGKGGEVN